MMATAGKIHIDVEVTGYWQTCPVCSGRGNLPKGFYLPHAYIDASDLTPELCRRCGGTGTIECPRLVEAVKDGARNA